MADISCNDPAHTNYDRAPVRDLADLLRACVELDQVIDSMLGDVTEAERRLLLQVRYATRRMSGV